MRFALPMALDDPEQNLTLAVIVFVIGFIATAATFITVFVAHRRAETGRIGGGRPARSEAGA